MTEIDLSRAECLEAFTRVGHNRQRPMFAGIEACGGQGMAAIFENLRG